MLEVLVDNETVVIDGEEFGLPDSSAVLQWSLHRSLDRRLALVSTSSAGTDASIIAFDLRIDLLADNVSLELTRGMIIEITSYQALSGDQVGLRAQIAEHLRTRVLNHAFGAAT